MARTRRQGHDRRARTLLRVVWAALVLLHVAPLARIGAEALYTGAGVEALLAVLLAQALFLLKFLDVRWLRLPSRQATLAALVVLGFVGHGGDIVGYEQVPMLEPVSAVVAIGVGTAARHHRRLLRWGTRLWASVQPRLQFEPAGLIELFATCGRSIAAVPCCAARAPPF